MPPIGVPSWCLNQDALEQFNYSNVNIPVYDYNTDDQDNSDIEERPSSKFDAPENAYDDNKPEIPIIDFNKDFHWIVLWILLYQERYRLSDVATNSLVAFIRYLLIQLDTNKYSFFPTSLYMARKELGVCAHIIKYASCEKCCKLYNVTDVSTDEPGQVPITSHCTYVDFSNHPMANQIKVPPETKRFQTYVETKMVKLVLEIQSNLKLPKLPETAETVRNI